MVSGLFRLGTKDGRLRVRHGVGLLVDEDVEGVIRSIQVPARARWGSMEEELTQDDGIARADEPTSSLPPDSV